MGGRVGTKAPGRLRELPLAADAVPAARLIPGDGDVDETLVEVALLRGGSAPCLFEHLMGVVVAAGGDQLETVFQPRGRP